jgi:transcriptional regulator with GAF, ATPase, and Fis domain
LRVLASGEIQRVGSTTARTVDVRVLAATHRNLQERIQNALFREDLYYRLAVVPIDLPPLRDRSDDMDELCSLLCNRIAGDIKVPARVVSPAALKNLKAYAFPGNVRELRNLLERALILGQQPELQPGDFLLQPAPTIAQVREAELDVEQLAALLPRQLDLRETLARIERSLIERALSLTNGVQAEAARCLEISRSDLGYKVGKYSLIGVSRTNVN